jgi:two-component system, chemotaxis family, response regulator PixG
MMTAQNTSITAFTKKLVELKQARFSGRLLLKSSFGQVWTVFLYLGRILYANGGIHPVRRWQRNLAIHCFQGKLPSLETMFNSINDLSGISADFQADCWEYQFLWAAMQQQMIARDQVVKMIQTMTVEVLFDVSQALQIAGEIIQEPPLSPQLVLIDIEQGLSEAQKLWQIWQTAQLFDIMPDQAPLIRDPYQLQQKVSPATYKTLAALLNGRRSLRDIAMHTKRNITDVTRSLLPYIEANLVELINIPDSQPLVTPTIPKIVTSQPTVSTSALIACVDDSPMVCQTMEKILTSAGYQFLQVQDSMRAIATLLSRKPDLVFLDLVMPNTNGYEICTQLRKVSAFKEVPIIILTGNDGIIDRVRAKVVGASHFISKPVDAPTVLEVVNQHLQKAHT